MSKTVRDKIDELIRLDEKKKKEKVQKEKIIFREYLLQVHKNPQVAQFSHSRIYSMITGEGVEELNSTDAEFFNVTKEYSFFEKQMKGAKNQIAEIMEYFEAGANGLPLGKKILLLFGPPASGKSTFVEVIKNGLTNYRKVPMYRIEGCPINEEPLHLIPENMREEFQKLLNVEIKGDLCPKCRAKLEEYTKKLGEVGYYDMPVEQFNISRRKMVGIGRFEPADEKAQDISDITGKENPAVTYNPNRGYDDPDAFTLNGAVPRGNRGLVEAVEMLKKGIDPKILWVFIELHEFGILAIPGSNKPPLDIDTVTFGHCNVVGFKWFMDDNSHEAIQSRIHAIPFGYNLRIKDEVQIYQKLLEQAKIRDRRIHVAPGALEITALFAVVTRLNPDTEFPSVIEKAKFLDGQVVPSVEDKEISVRCVLDKGQSNDDWSKRDGMFGISPRDIMSALSKAVVSSKGCKCLTPRKAMLFIMSNFENMPSITPESIKAYKSLLSEVTVEYGSYIVDMVNNAFLSSSDLASKKANGYIKDLMLHCQKSRKSSSSSQVKKNEEPDYVDMEKIEKYMGYTTTEMANSARGDNYQMYLEYVNEHGRFNLDDFPKLKEAIGKVLLDEMATNMLDILTVGDGSDPDNSEAVQYHDSLAKGLINSGYCKDCAPEAMDDARRFLKR